MALSFWCETHEASASHITCYFTCSNHTTSKSYNSHWICSQKQHLYFTPVFLKNKICCLWVLNKLLLCKEYMYMQRFSETQQKLLAFAAIFPMWHNITCLKWNKCSAWLVTPSYTAFWESWGPKLSMRACGTRVLLLFLHKLQALTVLSPSYLTNSQDPP